MILFEVLLAGLFLIAFVLLALELWTRWEERREWRAELQHRELDERQAANHAKPIGNVLVLRRMSESEDDAP